MPSAIAHAAVGASIACLRPRRQRPAWAVALLALLAAAPDLDVAGFRVGIAYGHPLGHRGLTHSLPFALAFAIFTAPLWRRVLGTASRDWGIWVALSFLALASHGVLDTFTDAGLGVGLFIPFENGRYFAPFRPLLTSPLSIRNFVSEAGGSILLNEALWVGVPLALAMLVGRIIRRRNAPLED